MNVNWEKVKELVGDQWEPYLKGFFDSPQAIEIYKTLIESKEQIVPLGKDMWNFLKYTDPNNIKMVVMGLDAYPGQYKKGLYHATGIPFDCSNSPLGKPQPSLVSFWEGLEEDLDQSLVHSLDLKFLLAQGVFMANYGITCKLYKTGSMLSIWDPFWKYFFEEFLNPYHVDAPIIFLGKEAANLKKYTSFQTIFELNHPSFAARNNEIWDTQKVFTKCNKIIIDLNGREYAINYNLDI